MAANVRALRVVIYDRQPEQELLDNIMITAGHENMQVLSLDEVRKLGKGTTSEDLKLKVRRPSPRTTTSRASCISTPAARWGLRSPKGVVSRDHAWQPLRFARHDLLASPGAWIPTTSFDFNSD